MKKIVLSIAGVMAAVAFAPEASAIPSFARQTGMACNACHQQHFPVLNGFGRAFKAAGYTMMGAQEKVEGEHLSIPATLNASMLLKYRYVKDGGRAGAIGGGTTAATNAGNGQWQMADEFSLFFGGRVAENIGFMFEGNTANVGGALIAGFKAPIGFDMGGVHLAAIPFTTDALGVSYGFELSSTGAMRANRWSEMRAETSAAQYVGLDGAASGFAFVAQNDMGYINLTKWSPSFAPGANGQAVASTDFKNNYIRIAATPTIADWSTHIAYGQMSGSSFANLAGVQQETRGSFFDVQAHGEVGGKELGLYLTQAKLPVANALIASAYAANGAGNGSSAWTIGADYSVIPHTLHIGAAYRNADKLVAGVSAPDDAVTVQAIYDLAQNVALHAYYVSHSGSTAAGAKTAGRNNRTLFMLEAAW
jgi:hypothetical protein